MTKQKTFHYGFALLRIIMSFEVVLAHFWTGPVTMFGIPFSILEVCAVPCFIVLSFYFMHGVFGNVHAKSQIIRTRLRKLIMPIIFYDLLYLILDLICINAFHFSCISGEIHRGGCN